MSPNKVKFTRHAIQRAIERKLWNYIDKKKFYFDSEYVAPYIARLESCLYIYKWEGDFVKIVTVYEV